MEQLRSTSPSRETLGVLLHGFLQGIKTDRQSCCWSGSVSSRLWIQRVQWVCQDQTQTWLPKCFPGFYPARGAPCSSPGTALTRTSTLGTDTARAAHTVIAISRIDSSPDIPWLHLSTKQNYVRMESSEHCCFSCPLPRFMEKTRGCKLEVLLLS